MIRNYFKVAFRNLWKNKGFTAINIIGLATGLTTCLLILFFVMDELSYDKYNTKLDRIYRIDNDIKFGGTHFILAVSPEPMGPAVKRDYPQVEQQVRMRNYGGMLVKKGNENIMEGMVLYVDSTIFDVFTFPMIEGDPRTALVDPKCVVITETMAKKYFNTTKNVVGQRLVINDTSSLKVTGVMKDIPRESHFRYDFFISLNGSIEPWEVGNWVSNNLNTYIVLKPGTNPKKFEEKLAELNDRYIGPQAKQLLGVTMEEFKKSGNRDEHLLFPLKKIHLYSNKTAELDANGSIQYVYIFSAIAIFILVIACINFMNLSTARSSNRAKEVGVRKVLGSMRKNLVWQFLTESMLISCIALVLALAFAILLLPFFNQLSGKEMSISLLTNSWVLPSLVILVLVVGFLAGSYPAFYLSSFQPIMVLKGKLAKGFKSGWLRSSLVVFQFAVSIILIVGTAVIYKQLNYIRTKNLGFNRDQVLVLQDTDPLGNQAKAFMQEVLNMSGVKNSTMTAFLPTNNWRTDNALYTEAVPDEKHAASMQIWNIDEGYIPTMGMQMAQGRNFSKDMPTDSNAIIINEAAARLLGFQDAVGKNLYSWDNFPDKKLFPYHIIGVIKDFNFNSLREQVSPMALKLREQRSGMAFKVDTKNIQSLVSQIEGKWKAMVPGMPFKYSFMDDDFNNIYKDETRIGRIFVSFASLAIFIACLGLFGLVTYAAEQRIKEIGIRKVLGASGGNIVSMLSKDFLKLVAVSLVFAIPVAWWAMNRWLQDFAYRVNVGVWVFVIAGFLALLIALVTVSFKAIGAALMNPVKSLRTE